MRPSHDVPEAPTHLRAGDLPQGLLEDLPTHAIRTESHPYVPLPRQSPHGEPPPLPGITPARDHSVISVMRGGRSRSAHAASPRVRIPSDPASVITASGNRSRSPLGSGTPKPQRLARRLEPSVDSGGTRSSPAPLHLDPGVRPDPVRPGQREAPPRRPPVAARYTPPQPGDPTAHSHVSPTAASGAAGHAAYPAGASSAQRAVSATAAGQSGITPPQRPSPPSGPHAVFSPTASQPVPSPAAPSRRAPTHGAPPPTAQPPAATAGAGAIDPLAVPTPPELAGVIYGHVRRIALQADLAGADRVLRDALAELTSSLSCAIVYPGEDGLWTLGDDDEVPRDHQRLVAVATARRAMISNHVAIIPVATTTETVAVITLTRNARQPGFQPLDHVAMVALAREAAPILHHLAVQHLQRASEIQADKGSLYRGEALEAHRTRGQEGELVQLSPTWVRRAYPILVVAMLAAVGFAIFIRVPTYSTGTAVVMFEGSTSVTATASGTVDQVFVRDNQPVKKGDPLVRMNSPDEAAQLAMSETEWRDTQVQFLFEQSDEQVRKTLAQAATNRDHALARVEARTIRAPRDGVVTNLHVKEGTALQLGSYVLQITDENSEIEVLGFLPSKDSPRIRATMGLQLELEGYTKARVIGAITHVQPDAVSAGEAAKLGSEMLAESIAKDLTSGTWITVRARLPSRTFQAERNTYHYHHGMRAKVEVKVQSKPFLATLLPAVEKYLPD